MTVQCTMYMAFQPFNFLRETEILRQTIHAFILTAIELDLAGFKSGMRQAPNHNLAATPGDEISLYSKLCNDISCAFNFTEILSATYVVKKSA
jgi:hypothetical protein